MLRPEEAQRPFTVTELANEIRRELRPLTAMLVKGEVSGMKRGTKGHYSFAIKDGQSLINGFLYADDARRVTTLPEDGQVFVFRGRVDFWTQYGTVRFVVDQIEFDDVGKLRARLEELKRQLEAEGAFAAARKRPLPFLPDAVALLTSPTGAVIHDLQEALAQVIVLARGGGSFEELYSFNTELVARAILDSRLPVVTALGHSSDRTIADMVADVEARTPTEAGSRVVPKKADLIAMLRERERRLDRETNLRVLRETERLQVKRSRLLQVLPAMLRVRTDRLALAAANLVRLSPVQQVARREEALRERARRLSAAGAARLTRARNALASRRAPDRLERALSERFAAATRGLDHRRERLLALSPDAVLSRGYSITQDAESGVVIRSATETSVDRRIRVRLATGRVGARVEQVEP